MIQKLQKWCSFWIQKQQKYCSFWIQKLWIWTKKLLDLEIVEMVRFPVPKTAEILQFLDQEIVKMGKKNLDAETVEMVWFLDPEIVEKVDKSFMAWLSHMHVRAAVATRTGI